MGSSESVPVIEPGTDRLPWMALVFYSTDTLVVVNGEPAVTDALRNAISTYWPDGIQREEIGERDGLHHFKFRGRPFSTFDKTDLRCVQRTFCHALSNMQSLGWQPVVASDLCYRDTSYRGGQRSSWILQKNQAAVRVAKQVACVALCRGDTVQLVNAPQWLQPVLKESAEEYCTIQKERVKPSGTEYDDYYVKLRGNPWSTTTDNLALAQGRWLLIDIFTKLSQKGFYYMANTNMDDQHDAIFFQMDDSRPPGECRYAMLSFGRRDCIDLYNVDEPSVCAVRTCIEQHWPLGFDKQKEHQELGKVELRMHGSPWESAEQEQTGARHLMAVILQVLLSKGWMVECALDVSTSDYDIGVFMLRSCVPASVQHLCIAPLNDDSLAVLNAPKDVNDAVERLLAQWQFGVVGRSDVYGGSRWLLQGSPWVVNSSESPHGCLLVCTLLNTLALMGWRAIASVDLDANVYRDRHRSADGKSTTTTIYTRDTHSIFFAYTGVTAPAGGAPIPSAPGLSSGFVDEPPPAYADLDEKGAQ